MTEQPSSPPRAERAIRTRPRAERAIRTRPRVERVERAIRTRPRRLRTSPAMRAMVAETSIAPRHLVLPVFVAEGLAEPRPISSMPGVVQHTLDTLRKAAVEVARAGLAGVMLF